MKIVDFSEINEALRLDKDGYIKSCDEAYEKQCLNVADEIAKTSSVRPIILLAGPSGSGKTTTALKIESYLDKMGLETHTISMDNYFLPKDMMQINETDGKIDYESPYRIDIPLLQEHMIKLANCEEVEVPVFDFPNQARLHGRTFKRKKGELVLFEGIHALNPEVTGHEDISSRLYVSVRTRIRLSDNKLFHPEYIRLMRRIIRDRAFRNRRPEETLDMFESVQQGENLYIAPYKERAKYHLDTFLEYEASVYKPYIIKDFERMKSEYPEYTKYLPVENLLKDIDGLDSDLLSQNSLCREFIGGSCYQY